MTPNDQKQMVSARDSINQLYSVARTVKESLFKIIVMGHDKSVHNSEIRNLQRELAGTLDKWQSFAQDRMEEAKDIRIDPNSQNYRTFEYPHIKAQIYATYDYPSILKYLEGIFTGIEEGTIESASDIEDFKKCTIEEAFKNSITEFNGLFDMLDATLLSAGPDSMHAFQNFQHYHPFRLSDKSQIIKSVEGAIDYLTGIDMEDKFGDNRIDKVKMAIATINHTIEFAMYMAAIFIIRIQIISDYIGHFAGPTPPAPHQESSVLPDDTEGQIQAMRGAGSPALAGLAGHVDMTSTIDGGITQGKEPVSIMKELNDALITKDSNHIDDFLTVLVEFLKAIGVSEKDITFRPQRKDGFATAVSQDEIQSREKKFDANKYTAKLKENELYKLVTTYQSVYGGNRGSISSWVNMFHNELIGALNNQYQRLGGTYVPKHEFIQVVRDMDKDATDVAKIKAAALELYTFAYRVLGNIQSNISSMNSMSSGRLEFKDEYSREPESRMSQGRLLGECALALVGFYSELAFVVSSKMKHFETMHNVATQQGWNQFMNMTSISFPNIGAMKAPEPEHKNDGVFNYKMSLASPHSSRMPAGDSLMFAVAAFDEMTLFDEWCRTLPEFDGCIYLSEDGESGMFNAIIAIIRGLIGNIGTWFNNYKPAVDWVTRYEQALTSAKFPTDKGISGVYDYKFNLPPTGLKELLDALENFVQSDVGKAGAHTTLAKTLKDNPLTGLWADNSETAPIRYKNKVMFGMESEQPAQAQTLHGEAIRKKMPDWIRDIKLAPDAQKEITALTNRLNKLVDDLRRKVIGATSTPAPKKTGGTDTATPPAPGTPAPATEAVMTEAKNTPPAPKNNPDGADKGDNKEKTTVEVVQKGGRAGATAIKTDQDKYATEIHNATNRLIVPLAAHLKEFFKNQYRYLKTAYSIRDEGQAVAQPAAQPAQPQQQ